MLSDIPLYATIPVKDLKKSMEFYGKTLGMDLIDQSPEGAWYKTGNTRFGIYVSSFAGDSKTPAAIWVVDNPKILVNILEKRGVIFETNDLLDYGAIRKGKLFEARGYSAAWFKDPSGNIIAIASLPNE